MLTAPWYPIVYVRGYAGSDVEVEDTVATPYMGFNLGSTKLRQRWTGDIERHVFESPLIRLMKEHGYADIYENGAEIPAKQPIAAKSIWIYRYYEPVSESLGVGERPTIEEYAEGLHDLIEQIRSQVCGTDRRSQRSFRVHLVAHSMGGLVVRCYLQKICADKQSGPAPVDKVLTYATPHSGIDFRVIGNLPGFITKNNVDNFNRERMREYLNLTPDDPVSSLGGRFDPSRFFCLIGTNARDYAAAWGASSLATGPMGDGLVQIKNASVLKAPRAFVHRSHSGHYGIVNSEEGYQNLSRFLFGRARVDAFLDVDELRLPPEVETALEEGKEVRASYHIEVIGRVRQAVWDLHRRTVGEHSAIFLPFDDMQRRKRDNRPIQLLSAFLKSARGKARRKLGFSIDLSVLVPEYEVDGFLMWDIHHAGGHLYRDKVNLEVTVGGSRPTVLRFGFDRETPNQAPHVVQTDQIVELGEGQEEFRIPIAQDTRPGLTGTLVFRVQPWQ